MKISSEARKTAKAIFSACLVDGILDASRVRGVVQKLSATKPRGYIAILERLKKLVALDSQRRMASVESAVPLGATEGFIRQQLESRYGHGLSYHFSVNPSVIGGLRVRVGFDVLDGSILGRIESLRSSLNVTCE